MVQHVDDDGPRDRPLPDDYDADAATMTPVVMVRMERRQSRLLSLHMTDAAVDVGDRDRVVIEPWLADDLQR